MKGIQANLARKSTENEDLQAELRLARENSSERERAAHDNHRKAAEARRALGQQLNSEMHKVKTPESMLE